MPHDPKKLHAEWMRLCASENRPHALELAEKLGVSECEMLASACGSRAAVSAVRLEADWASFLAKLPSIGHVKTVTRNRDAVIEVEGNYDNVEFFGAMGQSVSSIDLRIFLSRWAAAFAVHEETSRGQSRSLQFFDRSGRAIHKVYLRERTNVAAFDALVREHTSKNQSPAQVVEPSPSIPSPKPDAEVDVAGLRQSWLAMNDTHEFHGLLRKFEVTRTQALRLAGRDLARPVGTTALNQVLRAAASDAVPLMIFVGNGSIIQIYSGTIAKVAPAGPWINVLDPGFNLHVRTDRVAGAWVVRKPTVNEVITSLELYDADGEQIALLVGKRKHGEKENPAWRGLVENLDGV